jgi:hypothetical protein
MKTNLIVLSSAISLALLPGSALGQVFVGNLDGSSVSSTFDPGATVSLPAAGWVNVTGAARIFDGAGGNGALIHDSSPFGNYSVEYNTGVTMLANSTYTLTLDLGFIAGVGGGEASYSMQLGLIDGGNFTGLGAPVTGTATYLGNLSSGFISGVAQQIYSSDGTVPAGSLGVRFEQTQNNGPSDFFGIDNVRLTVVPEPEEYAMAGAVGLLAFAVFRRHKRLQTALTSQAPQPAV